MRTNRILYFHYYGKKGHISPYCYKLYGPKRSKYPSHNTLWIKKVSLVSQVAYTLLKATSQSSWYFDSGCSRHLIGKKMYLTQIQTLKGDMSYLEMEAEDKLLEKGQLSINGLHHLDYVLLVEALTANLISISQLCDDGMKVFFSKEGYTVNNSCDQTIMKGVRSADNCYMWISVNALVSRKSEDDE
ncbi:hypothetical protein LIER_08919 [Lithospermum erythrorhizon]|uniref:Retrovirus-related Pol polyprotein from transposon TNT 1-94-like beta-barrel domain-containing protein n=1 Tax=Lithospermum erythrorhizon TaxID=34254 RepID=A0AAV3PHQ2_LITER